MFDELIRQINSSVSGAGPSAAACKSLLVVVCVQGGWSQQHGRWFVDAERTGREMCRQLQLELAWLDAPVYPLMDRCDEPFCDFVVL